MNISMQRCLSVLCALALGSAMGKVYIEPSAIAIETKYQSLTIEQSIPSLPGKLALNPTQQENIILINRELSQQIKNILTEEQSKGFTAKLSEGLTLKLALQKIPLSSAQEERLQIVLKSAQKKIQRLLTPEQLNYIRQQQQRDRQQRNSLQLTAFLL